jgi:predicted aspartyl protease
MNETITLYEDGFTFTYNEKKRELATPVEIESALFTKERIKIKAVWDTGACQTIISSEVAKRLGLKCVSKISMSSISDENIPTSLYMAHLYLPNNKKCEVFAAEAHPKNCDILIGMDIISRGDFAVSNYNGKTTFTFRSPSLGELDFCKHRYIMPVRNESGKIGRNDPCPCGSGKKYKHCCNGK